MSGSNMLPTLYQEFIHKSRYARWLWDENRRENWDETVARYFNFFDEHVKDVTGYTVTKEERKPDEQFMASIEEQIGITGSSREGFRGDVAAYMFAKMRKGEKVSFRSYEPLREAIESFLISSVKSIARIVTKSKTRDEEQQKKYSEMVETMIKDYGYSADSAEEILAYASNHLWRDS